MRRFYDEVWTRYVPEREASLAAKKKDDIDIFEKMEEEKTEKAQKTELSGKPEKGKEKEKDNQLEAAVNLMKAIKVYRSGKS